MTNRPGLVPRWRVAVGVLFWAAALLLLVNLSWSAWFAWRPRGDALLHVALASPDMDLVNRWDDRTRVDMVKCAVTRVSSAYYIESNAAMRLPGGSGNAVRFAPPSPFLSEDGQHLQRLLEEGCDEASRTPGRTNYFAICSVGWPVRILWCGWTGSRGGFQWEPAGLTGIAVSEIPILAPRLGGSSTRFASMMPYRPLWQGQLAYAAASLLVVVLLRTLSRIWRLLRGRCVECKYDLRGNTSGVCPECGTARVRQLLRGGPPTPPADSALSAAGRGPCG